MRELVLISSQNTYIKSIEKDLKKYLHNDIILMASVEGVQNKLGIAFTDKCQPQMVLRQALKNVLKEYKHKYLSLLCQNVEDEIIGQFTRLNLDEEYYFVFGKIKFKGRIFIDSIFDFCAKEVKNSWNKVAEILNENGYILEEKANKNNLIKFFKNEDSEDWFWKFYVSKSKRKAGRYENTCN